MLIFLSIVSYFSVALWLNMLGGYTFNVKLSQKIGKIIKISTRNGRIDIE